MAKIALNNVASLANTASAKALLNENFAELARAIENTLSRDGSLPNQMEADIDLNSNSLLNVFRIDAQEIYRDGLPIEMEVAYANKRFQLFSGNSIQTEFTLSIDPASLGNLAVYISGIIQRPGIDFSYEGTTLQFVVAPPTGADNILVRYDQAVPTGITDGASIRYQQSGIGAFEFALDEKARERLAVLDFCPPNLRSSILAGTSVTDLADYIEAALDECATKPRARLIFGAGIYYVSRQIQPISQVGLEIVFEGGAQIVTTHPTDHVFVIGDGSNNPAHIFIDGGYFKSTVAKTDGAAIYVRNGHNVRMRGQIIAENMHDGVVWEGGTGQFGYYMSDFLFTQFSGDGVRFQNAGVGVGLLQDVHMHQGVISSSQPNAVGMVFKAGSGSYISKVDILGCRYSVFTQPVAGDNVNYSFFDQVLGDTPTDTAWSLNDLGGGVFLWAMSNCWGNTATNDGLFSGGTGPNSIRGVLVSNSTFSNNGANGVQLFRTNVHNFTNCFVAGNNTSGGPANRCGFKILAGCSDFSVVGCQIDNHYFPGIPGGQHFGIEVVGGASDRYIIALNRIRNNLTGQMTDGGTGVDKHVSLNVGYERPRRAATLSGAWVNTGGAYATAGYQKIDGLVKLSGTVQGGVAPSQIFVLPAGFRPAAQRVYSVIGNGVLARVDVKPDGSVELTTGAPPISLDSISFETT